MQTSKNRPSSSFVLSRKALMLVAGLLALACAPGAVPCAATPDCRGVGAAPLCAEPRTAFCNASVSPNECAFQLKNVSGCACILGDVRECTTSEGAKGVKRCVNATPTTTKWESSCAKLASLPVDTAVALNDDVR